ncbi:MAG: carbon storage regulator CsrA [Candidatus Gastranaerophilales bacterium]|nr:carbon storage regulator CsrA [Candidatus Gastranaerophilales bacterium]
MLILTRKLNQKLIIDDNIEIVILESSKNSVKIGVRAPKGVHIYREEIYNEIKKSNKQAGNLDIHAIDNLGAGSKQTSFDFMKKLQKND